MARTAADWLDEAERAFDAKDLERADTAAQIGLLAHFAGAARAAASPEPPAPAASPSSGLKKDGTPRAKPGRKPGAGPPKGPGNRDRKALAWDVMRLVRARGPQTMEQVRGAAGPISADDWYTLAGHPWFEVEAGRLTLSSDGHRVACGEGGKGTDEGVKGS